jgi:4-carboxymuconolactone decarboxylase
MNDEERLAEGRKLFKACYGDVLSLPETFDENGFVGLTLKNLFNDLFGRKGMSFRDRRLVILGALAALGTDPSLYEIHIKSALGNKELTPDELREVILTSLPYCGYPKVSPLYGIVEKCIAAAK